MRLEKNATFKNVYSIWIGEKIRKGMVSSMTISNYNSNWNRFLDKAEFIEKPISDIEIEELQSYFDNLAKTGTTKKTLLNIRSMVNGTFDFAYGNHITCISSKGIRLNTEDKPSDACVISKEDKRKLNSYLESLSNKTVFSLAIQLSLSLGIKIGELRALHWDDYDKDKKIIYIKRVMVDRAGNGKTRIATEIPHSDWSERFIFVSETGARVIENLRKINGDKTYMVNAGNDSPNPITTNHFNEKLKEYCAKAGIDPITSSHIKRDHTFHLFEDGIEVENVKEMIA